MKNPRYQGGGSSHVNSFKVTSVWDALTEKENVIYAEGFSSETDVYDEKLAAEAIEAAKQVDKAVVFAGLPESFESEGYDRKHMHLPECQNKLIAEIVKAQLNTIVVLHNGAAVDAVVKRCQRPGRGLPWRAGCRTGRGKYFVWKCKSVRKAGRNIANQVGR